MRYKAIFFDLYNTLIYTPVDTNPYIRFFKQVGLGDGEDVGRVTLTEKLDNFEAVAKRLNIKTDNINIAHFDATVKKEVSGAILSDDVVALFDLKKQDLKLGLISNLATPYADPVYRFSLDKIFNALVFSYKVGFKKPEKEIFLFGCDQLGVLPGDSLMIGDSLNDDYYGAKNAGLDALLLNRNNKKTEATFSVASLLEVNDFICRR